MEYFVGVVPPENLYNQIVSIQHKYGNNRTEPHITVKAQGGLTQDRSWMRDLEEIARTYKPFPLILGQTRTFGNDVLYFSIDSPRLVALHHDILKKINLSPKLLSRYFENEWYVPHLTIGQSAHGFSEKDLTALRQLADDWLTQQPREFTVSFLRVYYKPVEAYAYRKLADIELG